MLETFIFLLNNIPTEIMLVIEFMTATSLLLISLRFFGLFGLYAFLITSLFVANIQVLKIVEFGFYPHPVALGKVIICLSFFAIDIIVECYGREKARKAIWLGLYSNVTISILMLLTIGYKSFISTDPVYVNFTAHSESIENIFLPLPNILAAGIIAYIFSQYSDVFLFSKIREKTQGKYLWVRSFFAPAIASFLDNIIFYSLAFYVFSSAPLDIKVLINSYILGTYIFRVSLIFISSYVMYFARWIINRQHSKKLSPNQIYVHTTNSVYANV